MMGILVFNNKAFDTREELEQSQTYKQFLGNPDIEWSVVKHENHWNILRTDDVKFVGQQAHLRKTIEFN